jgi:hypothetical protein
VDGMFIAGLVAILLAAAGGYVWWTRHKAPAEEPVYHFRCPGCLRKLRYHPRQVGHRGKCSYCGHLLNFPPISWSLEERGSKSVSMD